MKLDLSILIYDEVMISAIVATGQKPPAEEDDPLTLGRALIRPIVMGNEGEKPSPEEKVKRYELMTKLLDAMKQTPQHIELKVADVGVLQKLVDGHYATLFHGRISHLLNHPVTEVTPEPAP